MLQFMKEFNYLEADPESVIKVLETFKTLNKTQVEVIEYEVAIK